MRRSWTGSMRELGLAAADVVRAELAALAAELGASGRALAAALAIAAVGGAFAFWSLGLFVDFAIELLALRLPRWGAVGVVLAVFLIAAAILFAVAWVRLRRLETPARTVQRRLEESRRWWSERIAPLDPAEDGQDDDEEEAAP